MNADSLIYVAGHTGLAGSAIVRRLQRDGHDNLILRTHGELDLIEQQQVRDFFAAEMPEYVFLPAGRVGGIWANATQSISFLYENLMIAANVIHAAAETGVEKLLFLGSSCIYPKHAPQPIPEDALLTGPLEETNAAYAIAKIAGLKLCEYYNAQGGRRFISAMPTNLYGPGDNFDPDYSHVIPGMMRRFHEAKQRGAESVMIWGTGTPQREFMHVDDLADALVLLMNDYEDARTINIGSGQEVTILGLAEIMKDITGFEGTIELDPTKPDGTHRKRLDTTRLSKLGWQPSIALRDGLASTYEWAVRNGELERSSR